MDSTVRVEQSLVVTGGALSRLSTETGEPTGEPVVIDAEPVLLGRGSHCHVVLNDPKVSTSHCELTATQRGIRLRDLGSTNGTYVHHVRLEAEHAVYLEGDARIRCGQTWLSLRTASPQRVAVASSSSFGPLVGGSLTMRRIYAQIAKVAAHDLNVLITGETGTGKELVARGIHDASRRRGGPLVTIDCASIPASLAESTLFGHEKGAFTGAVCKQVSPFVAATGGTLFFDELGELPLDVQPKLLRALETRQIQSVGSNRPESVDVRVIAATRRNLHVEMNARRFRDDLYFRFAQIVVTMPPLRERRDDIPALVERILADTGDSSAFDRVDRPVMDWLLRYDWPGNVRELKNVILAAHAQSLGGPIEVADLVSGRSAAPFSDSVSTQAAFSELKRTTLEQLERDYFGALHRETGGNLSEMARRSGLSRTMIRAYLERYAIRAPD